MSQYIPFLGGDGKWYYRTRVEGKGSPPSAPTETLSSNFNTYALMQTDLINKIFLECNYSEIAF
jgi:hypothetical protein